MVKRDLRTRSGRIRALGVDAAVVDGACELAIGACERAAIHGEEIELAGFAAYFKKEPLRGKSRARHGLWWRFARVALPRVREYHHLNWLREHGFGAPRPLAAGFVSRNGWPCFQFLFTELLAHAATLDHYAARAAEADRVGLLDAVARDLARMHALGFIHHDAFPRNILVAPDAHGVRIAWLDAWAGGPGYRWRAPSYDLACFLDGASDWLDGAGERRFLDAYLRARAHSSDAIDEGTLLRSVERARSSRRRSPGRASRDHLSDQACARAGSK